MTWAQFDLTAAIKRGQNAPSVIMWSIGNEVQEGAGSLNQQYADVQADLIRWAQELDTTKLVPEATMWSRAIRQELPMIS